MEEKVKDDAAAERHRRTSEIGGQWGSAARLL